MGILDNLKFVKAEAPKRINTTDKRIVVRRKMLDNIQRQLDLVDGQINNTPVVVEAGKRKPTVRYDLVSGVYVYYLHYGNVPVLVGGNNAIEAGKKLEDLKRIMGQLMTAVTDGELDAELLEASEKSPVAKAHAARAAAGQPAPARQARKKA